MVEQLDKLDKTFFLFLNSFHSPFFDRLMAYVSETWFWLPLFMILIYLTFKHFKKRTYLILIAITLIITLSDQISTQVFKKNFKRLRPCNNVELFSKIHLVGGCGSKYGFVSSHAADTFAGAMFFFLLLRSKIKGVSFLFLWSSIVSFSRIYLGRHYPGDVAAGALLGVAIALFIYFLYKYFDGKVYV